MSLGGEFSLEVLGEPGGYSTPRGQRWQEAIRTTIARGAGAEVLGPGSSLGVELVIRQHAYRPSDEVDLDNMVKHTIDALDAVLGRRPIGGRPQANDGRIDRIDARRVIVGPNEEPGASIRVWVLGETP